MADKISVEIDLEGGEQVEKQLADIGKAGQQAFGEIQSAADQVDLSSTTDQFDNLGDAGQAAFQKVQAAAKNAVVFEQIIQGVKQVEGAFESLGNAATKMAARVTKSLGVFVLARSLGPVGIAAGAAGALLLKFGNDAANALEGLTTEAAKLDLTAQQFDKLRQSLTQAGVSSDAIGPGLAKLKEALGEDFFKQDVVTGLQNFIAQLQRMPDGVERTQLAIQRLGEALGGQIIAGLQTGTITADKFAAALGTVTPATQAQIDAANRYQQALNQMSAAWQQFITEIATPLATPVFQFLTDQINKLKVDLQEIITEFNLLVAVWNLLTASADQQAAAAQRVLDLYKQIGQAGQQAKQGFQPWTPSAGTGAGPGFAGGGIIGGSGTGTSDSNLAWVSRGEHIMPARAVAQPGVLSFLEALRRSGGNLRGVLDGLGRFALGGLVPRSVPAFAGGGPVGGMSNVTIHFPGVPPITGLRASSQVINELQKSAALAQVRSGGRKPSRYS